MGSARKALTRAAAFSLAADRAVAAGHPNPSREGRRHRYRGLRASGRSGGEPPGVVGRRVMSPGRKRHPHGSSPPRQGPGSVWRGPSRSNPSGPVRAGRKAERLPGTAPGRMVPSRYELQAGALLDPAIGLVTGRVGAHRARRHGDDRVPQRSRRADRRCRSTGVIIDVAAVDVLDSFGFTTIRSVAEVARLRGALPVSSGSSRMWRWPRSGSGWAPARSPPLSTSTRAWPASTGSTLELRRRLDEPRSELACLGRGLIARSPSAERQFERWRPRPASSGEAGGRGLCERVSAWTPLRSRGSYGSGGCWATGEDERSPSGPDAWEARAGALRRAPRGR